MSDPRFEQINLLRELDTKAKATELARLMTLEREGERVHLYDAVHTAIIEAIEKRKKGRRK